MNNCSLKEMQYVHVRRWRLATAAPHEWGADCCCCSTAVDGCISETGSGCIVDPGIRLGLCGDQSAAGSAAEELEVQWQAVPLCGMEGGSAVEWKSCKGPF